MIRRILRLAAFAGVVAGIVAAVKALTRDDDPLPAPAAPAPEPWPKLPTQPAPASTAPEPDGVPVATAAWVEPTADGECPPGHPVKAKMRSKIFHSPGQLNYDRTTPDRCYVDAAGAEADGLRAAKR